MVEDVDGNFGINLNFIFYPVYTSGETATVNRHFYTGYITALRIVMKPFFALFLLLPCVNAIERVYYIGIVEEIWNYAPSGLNLITGVPLKDDPDGSVFYQNATNRIGSRYKKALYYQYEDDTFTTKMEKDPKLGFLGPTIAGEVGDVITIHAKNFAKQNFSLHPHGVQYLKDSEGAVYIDGSPDEDKYIAPNQMHTYTWNMHAEYGPTDYDPDCSTYMYHSHVNTIRDTYSGLLAGMLVCRKGTLRNDGARRDVDRNFILSFYVVDENFSWYIGENIKLFVTDPVDPEDPDFQESNTMHSINGLGYGNLQGLVACEGEKIGWNVFGFGNEVDIHSVRFEKQTVNVSNHRQDTINLFAAVFKSVTMIAANPGVSLISCMVNDHYSAGMYTSLNVSSTCGSSVATGDMTSVKNFFIAIEEQSWNYGPSGTNMMTGESLTAAGTDSSTFFTQGEARIGGIYKKARFVGYDDPSFESVSATRNVEGILGPLIAVEIGDVIYVSIKNNATIPYNIEPHGLQVSDTAAVQPGDTNTFTWTAPDFVSPTSKDPDCIPYLYTSTVDPVKDTNSGLVGPILLCKRGTLEKARNRNAYNLLFTVWDENQSHYLAENIATYATASTGLIDTDDEDFKESNLMHSINGLMYGNLEDISLCVGQETDFHVIGLGTEVDMHSMFASGVNIRVRNENRQVASVFPHSTTTTTVLPTSPGSGEIKCVVVDHLSGGMLTSYTVTPDCGDVTQDVSGVTREYFISVEEEIWDYVQGSQVDVFGNSLSDPDTTGYTFVHQETGLFIGSKYKKAIYHQYESSDFTTKVTKNQNLGVMGPVIGGEAGDTIRVTFHNMASRNYSIKPWGAKDKNDPFNIDTTGIPPGAQKIYEWTVPDSAVPPDGQPGCNAWIYQSNVDEIKDAYSGLLGPLLLCRTGSFDGVNGTDSYQEDFYLLFLVFDENQSHYLDDNIRIFAGTDAGSFDKENEKFHESNLLHGINGVIYGLRGLNTTRNDEVLWHLIGYGNEVDIHTVHFHAHAFTYISDVTTFDDVFNLFPGKIGTVHMRTTELGTWLMHCHVDDHIEAGMVTTFNVASQTGSAQSIRREALQIALIVIISKTLISVVSK